MFNFIRVAVCIFVLVCAAEVVAWPDWSSSSSQLCWWQFLPVAVEPDTQLHWWQNQWLAAVGVFVCCPPIYLVKHTDICHHPTCFIYYWVFVAVWLALLFGLLVAVERLFIRKYGKHDA